MQFLKITKNFGDLPIKLVVFKRTSLDQKIMHRLFCRMIDGEQDPELKSTDRQNCSLQAGEEQFHINSYSNKI